MFGQNPKRGIEKGDGKSLLVQEIFSTVQGEGPHTGEPSVFVRLGGCNLACHFCDTEFESFTEMRVDAILDEIDTLAEDGRTLVVITGGEPLRQPIEHFCRELLAEGYRVQIETNGTLWRELPDAVDIICSPKAGQTGYFALRPDVLQRAYVLKYIVSATHPIYSQVPTEGGDKIWVQPMDEYDPMKNTANMEYAMLLADQRGYKVSLQTHKLVTID